jgi:glycosyltransferase involved in cell wall biosynthesis
LVEPGNTDELGQRISELLSDRDLARQMGQAARAHVLERFTWNEVAERCLSAYEELPRGAV